MGSAGLAVSWYDSSSTHIAGAMMAIEMKNKAAIVSELHILRASEGSTINGLIGSQQALQMEVEFDDGTYFSSDAVSSRFPVAEYLSFASSNSDKLSVDSNGTLTLKGNSPGFNTINITVTAQAGTAKHLNGFYANLKPGEWDMDIEWGPTDIGSQFPAKGDGETFEALVSVNATTILKSFNFVVQVDPMVIRVMREADISRGRHWDKGTFSAKKRTESEWTVEGDNADASRQGLSEYHSPIHPSTRRLTHSLTHSISQSVTHSLTHSFTHSLTHSPTDSLSHPLYVGKVVSL